MSPTAPWWGVPVVAGAFLIIGGLLTFMYTYANERRKSRLEDERRFEAEIIALYETLDRGIEYLHNTEPPDEGDAEDVQRYKDVYWPIYLSILRAHQRLEIIAPVSLYAISARIQHHAYRFYPDERRVERDMPALVDAGEEMRQTLRRHLRIREGRRHWQDRRWAERVINWLPEDLQLRLEDRRRRH